MTISDGESGSSVRTKLNKVLGFEHEDNLGRSTVEGGATLSRRGNRMRKALRELSAGTRQSLRFLVVGDSLAGDSFGTVNNQLPALFAPWMNSASVYGQGSLTPGATNGLWNAGTAAFETKTYYADSWIGNATVHDATEYSIWSRGGNVPYCDRIIIPIVTASGAGTIKIEINDVDTATPAVGDADWRNPTAGEIVSSHSLTGSELLVSADAAAGLSIVILQRASLGRMSLKLTHSSGSSVKVLVPMFEVRNSSAVNTYKLTAGSNSFADESSSATAKMGALIAAYDPDLIIIDSDDNLAAYQNFLPLLDSALTAAAQTLPADVLLVQTAGIGAGGGVTETALVDRIRYCWEYGTPRGWDVLDGLALLGGIARLTAAGWNGDNIHLAEAAWSEMAIHWVKSRNLERPRLIRAGGDTASRQDIATGTAEREINASQIPFLLGLPHVIDTAAMTWAYATENGGTGTTNNGRNTLTTGTTANGRVAAYINDQFHAAGTLFGQRYANGRGGMSCLVYITGTFSANAAGWVLMRNTTAWNANYAGALTAGGFGFRITTNQVHGVSWDGSTMAVTASAGTLTAAEWSSLQCIIEVGTINATTGQIEFFFDGVSLGKTNYRHNISLVGPRVELTNGGDTTNNELRFWGPKVITVHV